MSKTGILTFHAAYNFGSNLQAYALQNVIEKLGHEVEIINYRPENQFGMYSLINTKYFNKGVVAKNFFNILNAPKIIKRNKNFYTFIHEYLKLSQNEYMNKNEVEKNINKYSNIVCGSDQIWNLSEKTYDRSTVYFLDLDVNIDANTVSYAPSFGDTTKNLSQTYDEKISQYIKNFDKISLREKDAVDFFRSKGVDADLVLDPTLLLSKEEWKKLIGEPLIKEPYIFYYSLNCKKFSIDFTNKIAEETKLPVLSPFLHPKTIGCDMKILGDSGPLEFLNLLYYSKIVCTNSFHGTVFSVLFEKDFYAIFDEDENKNIIRENRKASLLEQLGLEKNISSKSNYINIDNLKEVDYKNVKNKLDVLKKESINYLKRSLKG